jgi:transcriptional regulator with XRE-family HTH domain
MTRPRSGVNSRGIALELLRLRRDHKMSCAAVGTALGVSASTISRMENGIRIPTSEEVASILTYMGVKGLERQRLIEQARRQNDPNLLETAASTEQSRNYLNFELTATKITNFELTLVPGLAQTPEYAHAALSMLRPGDTDPDIEAWVRQRMSRQAILTRNDPPELHWILTEQALRQPIGGGTVMCRQVRRLIHLSEQPNITINVIPLKVVEHPGLEGQFVIMDFADEPSIVCVEAKTTGLFLDDGDKVSRYRLTAERLTELALDERESAQLLESIASDHDRE